MPKRKLHHVPGLLSLSLLALCCVFLLSRNKFQLNERIVRLFQIPKSSPLKNEIDSVLTTKKFEHFSIGEDEEQNVKVIRHAKQIIAELVRSGDSVNGVHFSIADKATFKSYMEIINTCLITKIKVYLPDGNDLWVFNPSIQKQENQVAGLCCNCITRDKASIQNEKERRKRLEQAKTGLNLSTRFRFTIVLFTFLLVLNLLKIQKNLSSSKRKLVLK